MIWQVLLVILCAQVAQPDDALAARLDRFDERTERIDDLTARFEQRKHSVLLRRPLVSRGRVLVKGETLLWMTREPVESRIRVDETDARVYYPDQNLLEIYDLGADLRFLAGSPVPRMASLREQFDIRETDADGMDDEVVRRDHLLIVALSPRDERLAERIERIRLVLDEDAGVMRLFEVTDPQGDRTTIVFKDIRTNTGLTEDDIALDVPPDARVTRPFGEDDPE